MPDPNVTLTAVETHATALEGAMKRHAANAGRCKVWSGAILAGVMVFAAGKAQMGALPWVARVVVLLALADACQAVLTRRCTEAYQSFMRRLPLNGGNAMKAEECFVLPAAEMKWSQTGQVLGAMGSMAVLPFYGAMLALVIGFHVQMSPPSPASSHARSAGCSAGGGCGTSGGCGSGGCGASSGKGCGCGSESSAIKAQAPTNRMPQSGTAKSSQAPVKSPVQMNMLLPTRSTGYPPGQPGQPGQPQALSLLRAATPPPGVRIPGMPPRPPQTGVPPNGVPPNGIPAQPPTQTGALQNAVPPQNGSPVQNGIPPSGVPSGSVPADGVPPAVAR